MIHSEPHELSGQTVKLTADFSDRSGELQPGMEYRVEDYWDRVSGGSWMNATGNPAAMKYAMRSGLSVKPIPIDNEVLYGKIGAFGHLIHVSEVETP